VLRLQVLSVSEPDGEDDGWETVPFDEPEDCGWQSVPFDIQQRPTDVGTYWALCMDWQIGWLDPLVPVG
jgi:hypothetical protein